MYSFDYQRPDQTDAAVAFLHANEDAKYLAGGQSLLPTMRLRLAQPSARAQAFCSPDLLRTA